MAGRVYATAEQYQARTGQDPPTDIDARLGYASEDVDDYLLTAMYETDPAGMPTDPDVVEAMANAVCDQVAYVIASGGDTTGATGQWDSVSIGPVSLGGRRKGTSGAGTGAALGPRAVQSLRRAGLMPGEVWPPPMPGEDTPWW